MNFLWLLRFLSAFSCWSPSYLEINSNVAMSIGNWSLKHGFKLNSDKCTVLYIALTTIIQSLLDGGMQVKFGNHHRKVTDTVRVWALYLIVASNFLIITPMIFNWVWEGCEVCTEIQSHPIRGSQAAAGSVIYSLRLFYYLPGFGNIITIEGMHRIKKKNYRAPPCGLSTIFVVVRCVLFLRCWRNFADSCCIQNANQTCPDLWST